jgi:hypothetical protein
VATKNYDILRGSILEQHRNGIVKTVRLTSKQAKEYRESLGKINWKETKKLRKEEKQSAKKRETAKRRAKSKKSLVKRISKLQPSLPKKRAQRSKLSSKMRIRLF